MNTYLSLLIFLLSCFVVSSVNTPYTVQRHKLFVNVIQANGTYTYYQHRIAINHVVQIPCYLDNRNLSLTWLDATSYEWLMNGRQIRTHTAFLYATWDVDGILTILASMIRQTTLWCHARQEDTSEPRDFYFAHQINFYEEPVQQVVISLYINFPIPGYVMEQKCKHEYSTCDCRMESGANASERFRQGMKNHFVRDAMYGMAVDVCQQAHYCQAVSMDDFQCLNDQVRNNSAHHAELSFFVDVGRRFDGLNIGRKLNKSTIRDDLEEKMMKIARDQCWNLKAILRQEYYLSNTICEISTSSAVFLFCMGPSSRLNHETEECELCPTGSYAPSRLVSPAPPHVQGQYQMLLSDDPYLADKHAREAAVSDWLNQEDTTKCLPCPSNTYAEELGRMLCLPCPVWHIMPEDLEGRKSAQTGSNWLHEACPREGYAEVRLIQVSEAMLGRRFAAWVVTASPLTRVGTLLAVFLVPLCVAICLLFIAYVLIDVGATLVKMAKQLHPLQVQIAETTTATAQFKADFRRATEEAYQRMRGK